jgi:hypothetical protein
LASNKDLLGVTKALCVITTNRPKSTFEQRADAQPNQPVRQITSFHPFDGQMTHSKTSFY